MGLQDFLLKQRQVLPKFYFNLMWGQYTIEKTTLVVCPSLALCGAK